MEQPEQLRELFRMQKALNARIGVHTDALSEEEKTKWVLNYCRAMSQEIAELTRGRRQFALLSSPVFYAAILDEHLRLLDMRPWLASKLLNDSSKKNCHENTPDKS